jgi:hypothetical protein
MVRRLFRIAAVLCPLVLVAGSIAFAANGGHRAPTPGLKQAIADTSASSSERYVVHVRLTHGAHPLSVHIRGQAAPRTVSVSVQIGRAREAALIDGPFLYERAPSSVGGKLRWLRVRLSDLPKGSHDLAVVHALTPAPLLRVLGAAHMARSASDPRSFHGTIRYDHPAVRTGLAPLTAGLEFRGLRLSAIVGGDGLLHRIVLTGHTADRSTTISLRARLYAFGKPLHVTPPAPGTFLDPHGAPPA